MPESTIPAIVRERASHQPDDVAFTFFDYEADPEGVAASLTWAQLHCRMTNLAHVLAEVASVGDRSVITAPQEMHYPVAFLASLEAGLVAVPLPTPDANTYDDRFSALLSDAAPAVVLTTTSTAEVVSGYARERQARVIVVDQLDLDVRPRPFRLRAPRPETAYLQYTSGSTRTPAGVMVTHRNLSANYEQIMADFFPEYGGKAPEGSTAVSWLPLHHDMGLMLGVCAPILGGWTAKVTTPRAFLRRPARWIQLLANSSKAITAAPSFAFEMAAAKTTDADLAGLDLADVAGLINGAERVRGTVLRRFTSRFSKFGLDGRAIKPCYGLAEATLYVATREPSDGPRVVHFDLDALATGRAVTCATDTGAALVSYGRPTPEVRVVDPDTRTECAEHSIGEIWTRGEHVCLGYWKKPEQTRATFGGVLANPLPDTATGPWLCTGDLGFTHDGELFVIGRIKDLLVVRGRNHYPDDIEATIGEITRGRVAAFAIDKDHTEQLVAVVELKPRGDYRTSDQDWVSAVKREINSAVSTAHGVTPADLVLVATGAIPTTTSGKIRRNAAAQYYSNGALARLDVDVSTAGW